MRKHCRQLDTCVGAPGPHGFAVRENRCSSVSTFASIASRLAFRDDRDPPLMSRRDGGNIYTTSDFQKEEYFCPNIWTTQIDLIPRMKLVSARTRIREVGAILKMAAIDLAGRRGESISAKRSEARRTG